MTEQRSERRRARAAPTAVSPAARSVSRWAEAAGDPAGGPERDGPAPASVARASGLPVGSDGNTPDAGHNPWERFGWLMRAVWLVFLIYPLISVFQSGRGALVEIVGVMLVAAFVVVYLGGMGALDKREERGEERNRLSGLLLVALCALSLLSAIIIGLNALGFMPFILSFAMFVLPIRWAFVSAAVGVALTMLLPWALGEFDEWWSFGLIVFSVVVATGLVRVAIEQGERYEQVRERLAVVDERERVARDVHDVLGHSLTVVTLKAELAERLVELDPERAKAELAEIQQLTRQALAEIRETVGGLRVARLDHELASARGALRAAGICSNLPDHGDPDITIVDPRHRAVLAWVLREAVTNVVRHSDADACSIELGSNVLTVADDGRGREGRPEGNGIRGLRERVEAAGGQLSYATGPDGHGTTLEVTM
ncbi:MAG: sensor histidine kinase [Humibacillus sp.]|nr:sensor histidine kinase [Humibacillus sp.]MDN5778056.1 sensor histidine kinase [Humibacillus sp.]